MRRTRNNRNQQRNRYKQKQHERHRTIRKPNENKRQVAITEANNKSVPQHHLPQTSTRHKTNALNELIRFVVSYGDHVHRQRTRRYHTEKKNSMTDITQQKKKHTQQKRDITRKKTCKLQNPHRFSKTTLWPMFQDALHRNHENAKRPKHTSSNAKSKRCASTMINI